MNILRAYYAVCAYTHNIYIYYIQQSNLINYFTVNSLCHARPVPYYIPTICFYQISKKI